MVDGTGVSLHTSYPLRSLTLINVYPFENGEKATTAICMQGWLVKVSLLQGIDLPVEIPAEGTSSPVEF